MQSGPEQMRDWMRRRGFTQADAARHFEFTQPMMSRILDGTYSPGLRAAIKIEQLAGIPVEVWASSELDESSDREPVTTAKRRVAR